MDSDDPLIRQQSLLATSYLLDPAERGIFPGLAVSLHKRSSTRVLHRLPTTIEKCKGMSDSVKIVRSSDNGANSCLQGGSSGKMIPVSKTLGEWEMDARSEDAETESLKLGKMPVTDPNNFFSDVPAGQESEKVPYSVAGFDPTNKLFKQVFLEPSFSLGGDKLPVSDDNGGEIQTAYDPGSEGSPESLHGDDDDWKKRHQMTSENRTATATNAPAEIIELGGDGADKLTVTLRAQAPLSEKNSKLYEALNRTQGISLGSAGLEIIMKSTPEGRARQGLRNNTWDGVPVLCRPHVWRILMGYAPTMQSRTSKDLHRKRREYSELVSFYENGGLGTEDEKIVHQLHLDLPRHKLAIFHLDGLVKRLSRCLFYWGSRNPAAGYVQGMDDIISVFFMVFLAEAISHHLASKKGLIADEATRTSELDLDSTESFLRRRMVDSQYGATAASLYQNKKRRDSRLASTSSTLNSRSGSRMSTPRTASLIPNAGARTRSQQEHNATVGVDLLNSSTSALFTSKVLREKLQRTQSKFGSSSEQNLQLDSTLMSTRTTLLEKAETDHSVNSSQLGLPDYTPELEAISVHSFVLATSKDAHRLFPVIAELSQEALDAVEADTYWCGGRMLSWVQSNFTHQQPGIKRLMGSLDSLMMLIDQSFIDALMEAGIVIAQFSFQWMHCMLMRELPLPLVARLWDSYFSLGDQFTKFHIYICAALILELKPVILQAALRDRGLPVESSNGELPGVFASHLQAQACSVDPDEDDERRQLRVEDETRLIAGVSPQVLQDMFKKPADRPIWWEGPSCDLKWMDMVIAEAFLLQMRFPGPASAL